MSETLTQKGAPERTYRMSCVDCDKLNSLLRQREEELATWKEKARWKHTHDDSLELELQKQLAAMTQERDRKSGLIKDLTQTLKNRNEQLAASQARCVELEEALKDIANYAGENGCCPYGCDTPDIAKRALTLTERPPA